MPTTHTRTRPDRSDAPVGPRAARANPWSPVQVVAVIVGIGYVVVGIGALIRTGLPLDHLDRPYRSVIGFRHSPLLGLAEIGFGLLLAGAGVVVGGGRTLMGLLGLTATGFGLMLLVDIAPDRLHHWFGVGDPYGWFSVIVGVFLVVTALFLPDVTARERQVTHRHVTT